MAHHQQPAVPAAMPIPAKAVGGVGVVEPQLRPQLRVPQVALEGLVVVEEVGVAQG